MLAALSWPDAFVSAVFLVCLCVCVCFFLWRVSR